MNTGRLNVLLAAMDKLTEALAELQAEQHQTMLVLRRIETQIKNATVPEFTATSKPDLGDSAD